MLPLIKFTTNSFLKSALNPGSLPAAMSVFTQKLNPLTGKSDWEARACDYDYHQEVARAAFADMLHDHDRNQKYEQGLKAAIEHMHRRGKKANVLDIGTGTGLLSMMAVRHRADSVVACEAFGPMSQCALKILEANGCKDKVKVVPKRSTELTVGPEADLPFKANILVTEVFDTELIGEGAFGTFSHAHRVLLEEDCVVVPHTATIYAQVVESPVVIGWNRLKDVYDDEGEPIVRVPDSMKTCMGAAAVHDIQLSQLDAGKVNFITPPVPVFRFDWSGRTPFVFNRTTVSTVKAESGGVAQGVFMWWDLTMDVENKVILNCAPSWVQEHPPWRDHWMQAVYYFPREMTVTKDEEVNLLSCHDEYSLWFSLRKDLKLVEQDYKGPVCDCGLHLAYARTRLGQMNDSRRAKKYLKLLAKEVREGDVILVLSHGFHLALAAKKLGAKKVVFLEENSLSRTFMEKMVLFNKIEGVVVAADVENAIEALGGAKIDMVLGEPHFVSSILPWDNLYFLYLLRDFQLVLADGARIFPRRGSVMAVPVEFEDLHKIRTPLGRCEGFDMHHFDELIEKSSKLSDDTVEAQPLWEYPGKAMADPLEIMNIELDKYQELELIESTGGFYLNHEGHCNGIAFWMDWDLDGSGEYIISTGPIKPIESGMKIDWDMHSRQGVHLFSRSVEEHVAFNFLYNQIAGSIAFKTL